MARLRGDIVDLYGMSCLLYGTWVVVVVVVVVVVAVVVVVGFASIAVVGQAISKPQRNVCLSANIISKSDSSVLVR